jgi:Uncharacterised nucleotidyltransferase
VNLSRHLTVGVMTLHVDRVTAEVVPAMRARGTRPLLLKGPSIATWLYIDRASRPYGDVDLLVEPRSYADAEHVLRGLGFSRMQAGWQELAWSWHRSDDSSTVDLHRSIVGADAPLEVVWRALSEHAQPMRVGGAEVEVLSPPARALQVALHAAKHGDAERQPLEDLARAVRLVDEGCWRKAAALARQVDAVPAFATGLRLDPGGAGLADRLDLPIERPAAVALRARRPPALVLGIEHLASARGVRTRLRFLARKAVPSRSYMRRTSALARRGAFGLGLAYLWRPVWIILKLPGAILTWRRARRDERSQSPVDRPDPVDQRQLRESDRGQ